MILLFKTEWGGGRGFGDVVTKEEMVVVARESCKGADGQGEVQGARGQVVARR